MFLYDWPLPRLVAKYSMVGDAPSNFCVFREWTLFGERKWKLDLPQPIQVSGPTNQKWMTSEQARQLE